MFFRKKEEEEAIDFFQRVELTLLDPRAISRDVYTLINVATKNGYYGVCVSPCMVGVARQYIDEKIRTNLGLVAVVGFPLGTSLTSVKVQEAKQAFGDGADEVDVVINIGKLKEGDYSYVKNELSRIVRVSKGRVVKAIVETCYLSREELKQVTKLCMKAKVDYIKTSTGYGTGGATNEDVQYIKELVGDKIKIKASGGIRSRAQAEELIRAGASRIGTSKVI